MHRTVINVTKPYSMKTSIASNKKSRVIQKDKPNVNKNYGVIQRVITYNNEPINNRENFIEICLLFFSDINTAITSHILRELYSLLNIKNKYKDGTFDIEGVIREMFNENITKRLFRWMYRFNDRNRKKTTAEIKRAKAYNDMGEDFFDALMFTHTAPRLTEKKETTLPKHSESTTEECRKRLHYEVVENDCSDEIYPPRKIRYYETFADDCSNEIYSIRNRLHFQDIHRKIPWKHLARIDETTPEDRIVVNYAKEAQTSKTQLGYYRTGHNKQWYLLKKAGEQKTFIVDIDSFKYELIDNPTFMENRFKEIPCVDSQNYWRMHLSKRGRLKGSLHGAQVNSYTYYMLTRMENHKIFIPYANSNLYANEYGIPYERMCIYISTNDNTKLDNNYNDYVLENARKCVARISASTHSSKYNIIKHHKGSAYYDYPCLVIEPLGQALDQFMNCFTKNTDYIKIFKRNSFGFLYPSISKLDKSVRIWPGMLEPEYFASMINSLLKTGHMETEVNVILKDTMIYKSLITAVRFIKFLFGKYSLASSPHFLRNRIIANMIKANVMLSLSNQKIDSNSKYKTFYLEISQIIENLNEYGLQLLSFVQPAASEVKTESIDLGLVKKMYGSNIKGFYFTGAKITQSGMQAGMIAKKMAEDDLRNNNIDPVIHTSRLYFEFPEHTQRKNSNILMYDPAYNFTHQKEITDAQKEKPYFAEYKIVILDITNVKSNEIHDTIERIANYTNVEVIYLFSSLSKHFQIGMDRFTLGIVAKYSRTQQPISNFPDINSSGGVHNNLIIYYNLMQEAQLGDTDSSAMDIIDEEQPMDIIEVDDSDLMEDP